MQIYLTHSTGFDYAHELYEPLKATLLTDRIYFPHDPQNNGKRSDESISNSDLILAEVSYPSTGQGIELGWADAKGIPIICFYRSDCKPSAALQAICDTFIAYDSPQDMVAQLQSHL